MVTVKEEEEEYHQDIPLVHDIANGVAGLEEVEEDEAGGDDQDTAG